MQSLCYITLLFLCGFASLSSGLQCSKEQYAWPIDPSKFCCDKCPPGKHMIRRPDNVCGIECGSCTENRYTDTYNVKMSCYICENCNKLNMEYESHCSTIRNAVCKCKAGFSCKDQQCTECIPIPTTTTKPTLPPSTTAFKAFTSTTLRVSPSPIKDMMWYLVIIALLCVGIALVVVTKLKPFLHWIRSKHGYLLAGKTIPLSERTTDDEGVSKPVQEMCGKCDQPIDV